MPIPLDQLPDDADALKLIIAAMAQDAVNAQAEIAKLRFQLARYRRAEFGRSSEKLEREADQLELVIETLEADQAERLAAASPVIAAAIEAVVENKKPARRTLPFAGNRPPAALFFYSPDRKGEHPRAHLQNFRGVIHADGYAGFNELFAGGAIVEAGCWAHVRRKFFDVHTAIGSPIAKEALERIAELYAVEEAIKGLPPDHRRRERQQRSQPIAAALAAWADETSRKLSRKSELASAFRYMRGRRPALIRCFDDGRLALDNNPAERALRGVAIGRKNYLFAGSDAGGRRAAAMYSLIETAKLNGINPQHYLTDVLVRIADHPARHIADLLPWNWQPAQPARAAA